jgi:antitoxin component YwqK of YwqJK toxin-antitoxin module
MEKGSYKDDEYNGTTQMFGEDGLLSRSLEYRLGYRHGKAILYKEGTIQKEINYWNGVIED